MLWPPSTSRYSILHGWADISVRNSVSTLLSVKPSCFLFPSIKGLDQASTLSRFLSRFPPVQVSWTTSWY